MSLFSSLKHRLVPLLRRLERITRTDNVYLVKNASLLVLTHGTSVLNGFLLYVFIAHFLPKETYGQYKYFLSLFGLFAIPTYTSMEIALARAIAHHHEGALRAAFRRKLLGGFIGSVIALCTAGYYALQHRMDLAIPIVLIAIFAPAIYASNVYSPFFTGRKDFATYTRITIITSMVSFFGMSAAFIFLRNPLWLFVAFLITSLTTLPAYFYARTLQKNSSTDPGMISFATHQSVLDILGTVANTIDGILIFHFLGAAPLAIYSLAIIPVEQMKGFLKSIQSIAMPKFSTGDLSTFQRTIWPKIALFMLGITGLMAIYALLAPPFFAIFFPAYRGSVPYSQVYSISLIFAMPAALIMTLFQAKQLRKETTIFNILTYSVQIGLLVILSWMYGLWGAIIARIAARALMFITASIMLLRHPAGSSPTAQPGDAS